VKVGDLVTVLPAACGIYLVTEFLRPADYPEAQNDLGALWMLYNEEMGFGKMHEKWMELISDSEINCL
jgi:hypothetical protein